MRVASGSTACAGGGADPLPGQRWCGSGQEHGLDWPILNRLLTQAVSTAKPGAHPNQPGHRRRLDQLGGVGSLAQLQGGPEPGLRRNSSALTGKQVAVVGAGRMARLLRSALQVEGLQGPGLATAPFWRAEALGGDFPEAGRCNAASSILGTLPEHLPRLVFTTRQQSSDHRSGPAAVAQRRSSLMLVDIGVPRNISSGVSVLAGVGSLLMSTTCRKVVERNQGHGGDLPPRPRSACRRGPQFLEMVGDGL